MTDDLRLNCNEVESSPNDINWQTARGSDLDGYRVHVCVECSDCSLMAVLSDEGEVECPEAIPEVTAVDDDGDEIEVRNECGGTFYGEVPMMDYWYPIKISDCEEAARLIEHLPLCVVEFDDGQTGLALTGGGMNYSWEICEAYVLLGHLPPLHFCDLPRMSGRGTSERDRATLAACMESCRIAEGWARDKRERLIQNFPG